MERDWQELRDRLRPYVARKVPALDVDDVVQETFVRMHRGAKLRDDERFGPWLLRVARSAMVDHLRARARSPLAREEPEDEPEPGDDGDERPAIAALTSVLRPFVERLPSPYREAIEMSELQGLTQEEAAARAGVSLSGMKSRVQRGRAKLREMLLACCAIELDARGRIVDCTPRRDPCACDGRSE